MGVGVTFKSCWMVQSFCTGLGKFPKKPQGDELYSPITHTDLAAATPWGVEEAAELRGPIVKPPVLGLR